MRHRAKVTAIGRRKFASEDDFKIFSAAAEGITIRARYAATYGMEFDAPKKLWPIFEIEFDEPQNILEYVGSVTDYVSFLSFCLGAKFKPSEIRIDRLSLSELMSAVKTRSYPGDHRVYYLWPESEIDSRSLSVGGSPVRAWDDDELKSFQECLVAWMNRVQAWRKAYRLMMQSFGLRNVISAERLINACRWLEEIPLSEAKNALSDSEIDIISTAAATKAKELGHPPIIQDRIASAVSRIKAESAEQRFTRLVNIVEGRFGKGVLDENIVSHLRRAIQFRGRIAHGHFNPKSDAEFTAFSKSIHAIEALCYLLIAVTLPISEAGRHRTGANPIVQDYRMAYE